MLGGAFADHFIASKDAVFSPLARSLFHYPAFYYISTGTIVGPFLHGDVSLMISRRAKLRIMIKIEPQKYQ